MKAYHHNNSASGDAFSLGMIVDRSSFDEVEVLKGMKGIQHAVNQSKTLDDGNGSQASSGSGVVVLSNGRVRRKLRWKPPGFRSRKKKSSSIASENGTIDGRSIFTKNTTKSFHSLHSTDTPVQSNRKNEPKRPRFVRPNYPDTFDDFAITDERRRDHREALPMHPEAMSDTGFDPYGANCSAFQPLGEIKQRPPLGRKHRRKLAREQRAMRASPDLTPTTASSSGSYMSSFSSPPGSAVKGDDEVEPWVTSFDETLSPNEESLNRIGSASISPISHRSFGSHHVESPGWNLEPSPNRQMLMQSNVLPEASSKSALPANPSLQFNPTLTTMIESSGLLINERDSEELAGPKTRRGYFRPLDMQDERYGQSSELSCDFDSKLTRLGGRDEVAILNSQDSITPLEGSLENFGILPSSPPPPPPPGHPPAPRKKERRRTRTQQSARTIDVDDPPPPPPSPPPPPLDRERFKTSRRSRARTGPVDVDEGKFLEAERNLRAIHDMAAEHLAHGEYPEAIEVFEEILRGQRERYGINHCRVGTALHNLGLAYIKSGDCEKAVEMSKEAVRVRRESLAPNHPEVAVSLAQLGIAFLESKKYREGLSVFREALRVRQMVLGPRHPRVAKVLNNIGCTLYKLDELAGAKSAFEEALEIQRETLRSITTTENSTGSNYILLSIASSLCNIGSVRLRWGELEEAIISLEEALLIQQSVLGDNHPTVLHTLESIDIVEKSGEGETFPSAKDLLSKWMDPQPLSAPSFEAEEDARQCPQNGFHKIVNANLLQSVGIGRSKMWYQKVTELADTACGSQEQYEADNAHGNR